MKISKLDRFSLIVSRIFSILVIAVFLIDLTSNHYSHDNKVSETSSIFKINDFNTQKNMGYSSNSCCPSHNSGSSSHCHSSHNFTPIDSSSDLFRLNRLIGKISWAYFNHYKSPYLLSLIKPPIGPHKLI